MQSPGVATINVMPAESSSLSVGASQELHTNAESPKSPGCGKAALHGGESFQRGSGPRRSNSKSDLIAGVVGFLDDRSQVGVGSGSGPLSQRTGRSYISYYSAEVGHYNPRIPSIRTPRRLLLGWLLCKITLNGTKLPAPSRKCGLGV